MAILKANQYSNKYIFNNVDELLRFGARGRAVSFVGISKKSVIDVSQ